MLYLRFSRFKAAVLAAISRLQKSVISPFSLSFPRNGGNCTIPSERSLAGVVLFCLLFTLTGCHEKPQVKTSDELLSDYSRFSDSVEQLPVIPASQLPDILVHWKYLEEEIFGSMSADSAEMVRNNAIMASMSLLGERVFQHVCTCIDGHLCSFEDLLLVQEGIASRMRYADVDESLANGLFADTQREWPDYSVTESERRYSRFLEESLSRDYSTMESVTSFLREEDACYQDYIDYLLDHDPEVAALIIENTEHAINHVFESAIEAGMDSKELLPLLTFRTDRRLIQCADQSLAFIENDLVDNLVEAAQCVSSSLSPFIFSGSHIPVLRSESHRHQLKSIAHRIPGALDLLSRNGFKVIAVPDSLPNRIMKDYVSCFINY